MSRFIGSPLKEMKNANRQACADFTNRMCLNQMIMEHRLMETQSHGEHREVRDRDGAGVGESAATSTQKILNSKFQIPNLRPPSLIPNPISIPLLVRSVSLWFICFLIVFPTSTLSAEPKAACSIHLGYPAADATLFYNEMTIEKSTAGSYFMAAGWNTGYFGLQELSGGKKIVLFSVWDPTKGDNPQDVPLEERVECLHQASDVQIKRFGGEGTGGQCLGTFPWRIGSTYRFIVTAKVQDEKTAYSGYIWIDATKQWKHLVTFRTRTGGKPLKGLYSFVEDFRRDGASVHEVRRASFGNGWVRTTTDRWQPLLKANFTASRAPTEALETINAGLMETRFFLQTGGETKQVATLNKPLTRPDKPAEEDHPMLPAEVK